MTGDGPAAGRLRELAVEHRLPPAALAGLAALLALVARDDQAPTTVREPSAAVDVHVADSLTGLGVPALREAATLADLGAGAGFPGLPLALALPAARVWLLESVTRKCAFLTRAIAVAGAENAVVACDRAELWPVRELDVVTARAVAPLAVLAELAAPLLREGGVLVAWKGRRARDEEAAAAAAAGRLGLEVAEVRAVQPFPGAEHRALHVLVKVAPTPPGFPRRPGMARKRPLAA